MASLSNDAALLKRKPEAGSFPLQLTPFTNNQQPRCFGLFAERLLLDTKLVLQLAKALVRPRTAQVNGLRD